MTVNSFLDSQYPRFSTMVQPNYGTSANAATPYNTTVTSIATAGNVTYTAAQLLGGFILRDGNGGARTDVLPTAALLVAAMNGVQPGVGFEFTIRNTSTTAISITMSAGTGATLSPTSQAIAQNNGKRFLIVITTITAGSEAYTCYSLGTSVT